MARIISEDDIKEGDKVERIICSHCESAQIRLIGNNIAECTVCYAIRAV